MLYALPVVGGTSDRAGRLSSIPMTFAFQGKVP